MPNDLDNFSLYVVVEGSGSINFKGSGLRLQPNGGAFELEFGYQLGDPPAIRFQVSIDDAAATVQVVPSAPVRQRQRMGGSPSEMEDIPADEEQTGKVTGTIPVNTSTTEKMYAVKILMSDQQE